MHLYSRITPIPQCKHPPCTFAIIAFMSDLRVRMLQNRLVALAIDTFNCCCYPVQDSGTPRRSANHTFTITIVSVPPKEPIFLHMERYHFLTAEVSDGGTAIDCIMRTVSWCCIGFVPICSMHL